MFTPVHEAGRKAEEIAARVHAALFGLGDARLRALLEQVAREGERERLVYLHDDVKESVRVFASPVVALPDQLSYCRTVSLALHRALKRLPDLYFADPAVREALRLPEVEEAWLREYWTPGAREVNSVFGRHDAVCEFASPTWKESLRFLEPNMSGIGGLHFVPSADRVLARTVLPALHAADPALMLETAQDIRGLLMQELLDHLESLGRAGRTVCFVEPKYAGAGPDEQAELARYVHDHFGLAVCHADPAELEIAGEEVVFGGRVVDLVYRDYSVLDLLDAAEDGTDIAPMRQLFAQNRVVSSIAAELDQKSCWEVFTDPDVVARHFDSDDRRFFRRHVPWTRVLSDRRTTLVDDRAGDLLPFVVRSREQLVLKPNRAYGGQGVLVGAHATEGEWQSAMDEALADSDRWVVQAAVRLPVLELPSTTEAGGVAHEPYFVVLGFATSTYGMAILGRASQQHVVNVARRGGIAVVVIGHPPGRVVI